MSANSRKTREDERPSITKVLRHYARAGWVDDLPESGHGWRGCHCPFHEDSHKSARVNTTVDAFTCLACDVTGDSWSLIMEFEGVKFPEAIEFASRTFGGSYSDVRRTAQRRQPYKPSWT